MGHQKIAIAILTLTFNLTLAIAIAIAILTLPSNLTFAIEIAIKFRNLLGPGQYPGSGPRGRGSAAAPQPRPLGPGPGYRGGWGASPNFSGVERGVGILGYRRGWG